MLLANFTTVRPEMGNLCCSFKIPLIAGTPSLANNSDYGESAAVL